MQLPNRRLLLLVPACSFVRPLVSLAILPTYKEGLNPRPMTEIRPRATGLMRLKQWITLEAQRAK
jgi:hypothetical protein